MRDYEFRFSLQFTNEGYGHGEPQTAYTSASSRKNALLIFSFDYHW